MSFYIIYVNIYIQYNIYIQIHITTIPTNNIIVKNLMKILK